MEVSPQDIAKLPERQRDVLGQICLNNDSGHHKKTLEALERKGFIKSYEQVLGGHFPVRIKRYTYSSIAVHMAWCMWASTNFESEHESLDNIIWDEEDEALANAP
jgi:hypothetical protein